MVLLDILLVYFLFALLCFDLPVPLPFVVGYRTANEERQKSMPVVHVAEACGSTTVPTAPLPVILDANIFSPCCSCCMMKLQVNVMTVGQPVRRLRCAVVPPGSFRRDMSRRFHRKSCLHTARQNLTLSPLSAASPLACTVLLVIIT